MWSCGSPPGGEGLCIWEQNTAWKWLPTTWLGELSSLRGIPRGTECVPTSSGGWKGRREPSIGVFYAYCVPALLYRGDRLTVGVTEGPEVAKPSSESSSVLL